jgi:hypothetical protein
VASDLGRAETGEGNTNRVINLSNQMLRFILEGRHVCGCRNVLCEELDWIRLAFKLQIVCLVLFSKVLDEQM